MRKRANVFTALVLATALVATGCGAGPDSEKTNKKTVSVPKNVEAVSERTVYVSPEWVYSLIEGDQPESDNYKILECSWGTEEDSPTYEKGHIPGAIHVNTDDIESPEKWDFRSAKEIKNLVLKDGITKDTVVVCYGNDENIAADDRVATALLWLGVENVKVMNQGLPGWEKKDFPVNTDKVKCKAVKDFGTKVPANPQFIIDTEGVKDNLANDENFKLVSIRSRDEFEGRTSGYSYIDKAGEPEGAIWGHDTDDGSYCDKEGNIVGIESLNKYLEESGASTKNDLAFYCGTGWRAAIPFLICYEKGLDNMYLFDDGWFVWQMDPKNKVQVGDPAGSDCKITTVSELPKGKAKK